MILYDIHIILNKQHISNKLINLILKNKIIHNDNVVLWEMIMQYRTGIVQSHLPMAQCSGIGLPLGGGCYSPRQLLLSLCQQVAC